MSEVTQKKFESPEETALFAEEYVQGLEKKSDSATVVCLYGDLGAGKTTFVKAAARTLGVQEIVTSPTFVIEKMYDIDHGGFKKLFHIDAYRLKEGSELLAIGWNDIISHPEHIIFIEWPKYVADVHTKERHNITFTFIDDQTRTVDIV